MHPFCARTAAAVSSIPQSAAQPVAHPWEPAERKKTGERGLLQ
jgi:hypothetical protein